MPKSQLVELYARSLGVIEEARVHFGERFNVITGETGAGKTLLLGALELSLGVDGGSSRYALTNESRATALFDDAGQERVFARESGASGRLRSTLDGAPTSVDLLREASQKLIVIHGQHDSLALRNRAEIVRIIDRAGGVDTTELDGIRHSLREAYEERRAGGGDSATRERELEFLRFQASEIDNAKIVDADELHRSLDELQGLTELIDAQAGIAMVAEGLDGDGDDAVLSRFAALVQALPHSPALEGVRESLRSCLNSTRDAVSDLRSLANPDAIDGERFDALQDRIALLQSIVRKYGPTLADVIAHGEVTEKAAEQLATAMSRLSGLDAEIADLEARERSAAQEVRKAREFAAVGLTNAVRAQLPRVALPNATLRFVVDGLDGSDAQILFTPNPGQAEGPLQALASGGELSRVLLALSLVADDDYLVAVFDEVDAGIGGQVAQQIGACLAELGQRQQVIAVTHLASVAAKAQHHFVIQKSVDGGITRTTVTEVTGPFRVREIARMLAGDAITEEAVALAQRLLESNN